MLRKTEEIPGLRLFEVKHFPDDRGYFLQSYVSSDLLRRGIPGQFQQAVQSCSRKGVVRGLHFQWEPPMGKLIRCVSGRIFDVAVDLRHGSPTQGDHAVAEMSGENRSVFWLPAGFAHGFMALEEDSIVLYECTAEWSPKCEAGIAWNDQQLGIAWPDLEPMLSPKDRESMSYEQWLSHPASGRFVYPRH